MAIFCISVKSKKWTAINFGSLFFILKICWCSFQMLLYVSLSVRPTKWHFKPSICSSAWYSEFKYYILVCVKSAVTVIWLDLADVQLQNVRWKVQVFAHCSEQYVILYSYSIHGNTANGTFIKTTIIWYLYCK